MRVDGEAIPFQGIESGSGWVLQATIGSILVSIVGVRWPRRGLELVRVADVEPYIPGWEAYARTVR